MDKEIIDYLQKFGFKFFPNESNQMSARSIEHTGGRRKYILLCQDYRRSIFLIWISPEDSIVYILVGDDKSTEKTRETIGLTSFGNYRIKSVKHFKKEFRQHYINRYSRLRWYFRPIIKPFFKYLKMKETTHFGLELDL